jgi:serine/threonine protein kinase
MMVRIESRAEPLPGYRLVERLGRGGFGEVWRVEAPGGLPKAIKFVFNHDLPDDQRGLGQQELKALNRVKRVRHPYILSLERFDIIDDCLLIVMELADRNLAERLKEAKDQGLQGIPRDELLRYMEETAEALDLMNQTYDLQHLDIKPQNLFLVHKHVKIGDFGLVKDLEGLVAPVTGGVTPVYAAPETFEGWVSRFCDQYSLAIVYQELLTGLRPFRGTNARQLLVQHLQGSPDLSPLPPSDRDAIGRALAKDPNQRHASCLDMVRALKIASAPPLPARPSGEPISNLDHDTISDSKGRKLPITSTPPSTYLSVPVTADSELGMALGAPQEAPPETTGNGCLFPALLVGLGNQGLQVLRGVRRELAERVNLDSLRNLRLMLIDTDVDTIHAAYEGPDHALQPEQTFLVRLQRPGYYLRPRDWQVPYDSWMPSQTVYRMTRNQTTAGIRCLGRLAFCDHYRSIAGRLRSELTACLDPEALRAAAEDTKLGFVSNRPRVYIVTSLAGGTGSGMFLDVAYLLRALLKQLGYATPELVGVFVLPAAGADSALSPELGNTYAALTELTYYSQPDTAFLARYHAKDIPYRDPDPPFERCFLISPRENEPGEAASDPGGLASAFLTRDLCTPLGRAADAGRAAANPAESQAARKPLLATIGLCRFAFPRHALIEEATQRICSQLLERWMVKGTAGVREAVKGWLDEQLPELRLDADTVLTQLRDAAETGPEPPSADALKAIIERFATEHPGGNATAADVMQALDQLGYIVGKPKDDGSTPSAAFAIALSKVTGPMAQQYERRLNEFTISLVDRPGFRFSGAEEAIGQTTTLLERLVTQVETLAKKLARQATETCTQILSLADGLEKNRVWGKLRMAGMRGPLELLDMYGKARYDCLLLQSAAAIYQTVLSGRPQLLREIGFFRHRVGELLGAFGPHGEQAYEPRLAQGRYVFPSQCQSFAEAVDQFVQEMTLDDLVQLDQRIQVAINGRFGSLVKFCLNVSHGVRELEESIREKAWDYLEPRLAAQDVAEIFLRPEISAGELQKELKEAYDEARPPLLDASRANAAIGVLGVPPSPAGEQFRRLAVRALADGKLAVVSSPDEIVLYRELVGLAITDFPQLGPLAHESYTQMAALEQLTPHSRTDVDWFSPVSGSARTVYIGSSGLNA